MPHVCHFSCGRTIENFVPFAFSSSFKADSIAWNEICVCACCWCILLYLHSRNASTPPNNSRRTRHTTAAVVPLPSVSHGAVIREKDTQWGGKKTKQVMWHGCPKWPHLQYICTVTKVTRAIRFNSLACLAAVVAAAVVMIYWSHCGKSFTTETPAVIQCTEQSAIGTQFNIDTRHKGMRESHFLISRTQHSELTEINLSVSKVLKLKTFAKIQEVLSAKCPLSKFKALIRHAWVQNVSFQSVILLFINYWVIVTNVRRQMQHLWFCNRSIWSKFSCFIYGRLV